MRAAVLAILAASLAGATQARAATLRGFVDGFSNDAAEGWACAPDAAADVSIAAYAGPLLVGIYPRTRPRPDVAPFCPGAVPLGFSIVFDPATQALFTGQAALSLRAQATGYPPRLLPGSKPETADPLPLAAGRLLGLRADGLVAGTVAAADGPPRISLFAGGPTNQGLGMQTGIAVAAGAGHYTVQLPPPGISAIRQAGIMLPVFGSSTSAAGVTAPMAGALALTFATSPSDAAAHIPITATIAQSGVVSGIASTLLTTWMPPGTGFAGLSGTLRFSGNDSTFSEALVELGTTADSQATCLARNGQTPAAIPVISRLWAGILKSNDTAQVGIPVDFALPRVIAGQPGGTCLMAWVSAGYPFLSATVARYTRTTLSLRAETALVPPAAPTVIAFGVGGEFRTVSNLPQPGGVYVGIMATQPLAVDGIAGTASAAPVLGAPANSPWITPTGYWTAGVTFFYLPAASCAAAKLRAQPATGPLAVLRNFTPITFAIPPGGVPILAMPMQSHGAQAVQRSTYASFPPGKPGSFLAPGDCLVAFMSGDTASLDVENQSTVYVRTLK